MIVLWKNGKCGNSDCENHEDPPGGDLEKLACSVCGTKGCVLCMPEDGVCKGCREMQNDPNTKGGYQYFTHPEEVEVD